jgi:hypothetical protein
VTSSPAPDTRKTANHRGHQKTGSRVRLDELYFLEYRKGLLDACREQRIALVAYSPLGTGRHLASETVTRVAHRLGRTAAQVLLRWCVQRGVPSIPKSRHRELIAENAQIRLRPVERGRCSARCARSNRSHGASARAQMVVTAASSSASDEIVASGDMYRPFDGDADGSDDSGGGQGPPVMLVGDEPDQGGTIDNRLGRSCIDRSVS